MGRRAAVPATQQTWSRKYTPTVADLTLDDNPTAPNETLN